MKRESWLSSVPMRSLPTGELSGAICLQSEGSAGWFMPSRRSLDLKQYWHILRAIPTALPYRTGGSLPSTSVTFRYKDYRRDGPDRQSVMTLCADEFIRRFLLHALSSGFHRIRHYGLLASSARKNSLALARALLNAAPPPEPDTADDVIEVHPP